MDEHLILTDEASQNDPHLRLCRALLARALKDAADPDHRAEVERFLQGEFCECLWSVCGWPSHPERVLEHIEIEEYQLALL